MASYKLKSGTPFLFDDSNNIVGVKNPDGTESYFPRATTQARADAAAANEADTWTPALAGSGGAVTYTSRDANYVRAGNLVVVTFWIRVASTTLTGAISVSGLPIVSSALQTRPVPSIRAHNTLATGIVSGWLPVSSTSLRLTNVAAGTTADLDGADLQAGCEIGGTLAYIID